MKKIKIIFVMLILSFFLFSCKKEYQVNLHIDDEVVSLKVEKNGQIDYNNPLKDGYKFVGWYTDEAYQNEYKTCPDNGFYSIMDSPTCQDEQGQVRPCTLNELKEICNSSPYCIAIGSSNTLYRRNGIHSQRINI